MINTTILLSVVNIIASVILVNVAMFKLKSTICEHLTQIVNIIPYLGIASAGINIVFIVYIQTDSATIAAVQVWMLLMILSMCRLVSLAK